MIDILSESIVSVLVFSVTWRSRSDDGDWFSESLLVDRLHWCDSGDWGFLSWVLFFVWVCTSLYEFYMTNFSFFYKFNFEELFYFVQLNWFVLCHPRYIFGWGVVMSQDICWVDRRLIGLLVKPLLYKNKLAKSSCSLIIVLQWWTIFSDNSPPVMTFSH